MDNLRIADRRFRKRSPPCSDFDCPLHEPFRLALREKRRADDQDGSSRGGEPDQGMKDEERQNENRDPGHIQESGRPHPGKKGADMLDVTDGLHHARAVPPFQAQAGNGSVDRPLQRNVKQRPDPRQHPGARCIQVTLQEIGGEKDHGQSGQRCEAAARKNAVVDLQHVEGTGQRQHVDRAAESGDADDTPTGIAQRNCYRIRCFRTPYRHNIG